MLAVEKDHKDVCIVLAKHGAQLEAKDRVRASCITNQNNHIHSGTHSPGALQHGRTALHIAAINGKDVCAEVLVNAGAQVDARDHDENTPLLLAARYGKLPVVKLLLKHKADVCAVNAGGHSAADASRQGGHSETSNFILDAEIEASM
jgi:ankyrin repeat protein